MRGKIGDYAMSEIEELKELIEHEMSNIRKQSDFPNVFDRGQIAAYEDVIFLIKTLHDKYSTATAK